MNMNLHSLVPDKTYLTFISGGNSFIFKKSAINAIQVSQPYSGARFLTIYVNNDHCTISISEETLNELTQILGFRYLFKEMQTHSKLT